MFSFKLIDDMTAGRGRFIHPLTNTSKAVLEKEIKKALDQSGFNEQLKKLKQREAELKEVQEQNVSTTQELEEKVKKIKQEKEDLKRRKEEMENQITQWQKETGGNATEPVSNNISSGGCYPGSATVIDILGRRRRMDSLKVEDKVQVMTSEGIRVDPVITFIHRQPEVLQEFIRIATLKKRKILLITEDHLLFVEKGGRASTIPAREVSIGDTVYVKGDQDALETDVVQSISSVTEKGVYAPVTLSGTILVNDVHTSCYFDVLSHEWSHRATGVARAVYHVSPWMVEWISGIREKDGFPGWCRLAHKILTFMA